MNDFATRVLTAPLGKTYLFSVGQAGYIIKSKSGQLLAIDLYLSDCVERIEGHVGYKRMLPKILSPDELEFDVVIATHPHKDHFDDDSMPEFLANRRTQLFASVECEKEVKRFGMYEDNVTYVKPGETYTQGDFTIDFVSCDHGAGAPDAVGVVVSVDGKKIYEAGDTCLRLDRIDEYKSKGQFDVFIAPINGMYGNLNAEECARLADALKPKLTIPCHYGMFASHMGSPGEFFNIMTERYPDNEFLIMTQGEKLVIE
jgi:L-ascorbate 6-phosphate lactonase